MSIGNQWTDPNSQILTHAAQAFYLGLVDEAQSEHLLSLAHEAVARNLVFPLVPISVVSVYLIDRKEILSVLWKSA